jgi:CheY-like chemotaxis protein
MVEEAAVRRRILVVEDDPEISELLVTLLRDAGYAVEAVDSAFGVAGIIRRSRPDVILLDLGLPSRSGASLLGALKADPETADVAVVVVSAFAEMLGPGRRALARTVIPKPFDNDVLMEAVAEACRR